MCRKGQQMRNVLISLAVMFTLSAVSWPAYGREPNQTVVRIQQHKDLPAAGRVERNIIYGRAAGVDLMLDLYYPADPNIVKPPLVVFVHGGAWQLGNKTFFVVPVLPELLKRGYAVASIGYRLAPKYQFPAQIEDVRSAVRYLRTHADKYGISTERIGAWGESAGGHLVSLLGLAGEEAGFDGENQWSGKPSGVQAVVSLFGPTNIRRLGARSINRTVFGAESFDDP
ncbi:MAG TPA: alpha/beta hydrolase, partial [Sedimentisphaerales bacterium]|nr:alpha/beta hydrolase [Sedimentisphaerales bacterium]